MKGDSRWVTALHYAFQDEEYLVRMPRKLEGRGGGGSLAQLCSTLCNPMGCSMPGFPVLH